MVIEIINYDVITTDVTLRYTVTGELNYDEFPKTDREKGMLVFYELSPERDENFLNYIGQKVVDGELVFGTEPRPEPPEPEPDPYEGLDMGDMLASLTALGVEPVEVVG